MNRKLYGACTGAIGVCFLLYYLVVRLVFIQGINTQLAHLRVHSLGDLIANLSGYLIVYLIWVYSFKIGMLLAIISGALIAGMEVRELWMFIVGGVLYLVSCYVPIVGYNPPYYGILGVIILVLFLLIIWNWMKRRPRLEQSARIACDLRIVGYFFMVVATWGLCGIFGIVTYALKPEIMIERGLQSTTFMLTSHVMMELSLGWLFIFLGMKKENSIS